MRFKTEWRLFDCVAAAALLLLLGAGAAQALESDRQQEIVFEADHFERDEGARTTTLTGDVILKQGTLDIRARRAVLHGDVRDFRKLVVEGGPATLEQALDNQPGKMHAEASRIDYDLVARELILTGDAVVDQGGRHMSGERIRYDLGENRVVADSSGDPEGGRVRIRIEPEDSGAKNDGG